MACDGVPHAAVAEFEGQYTLNSRDSILNYPLSVGCPLDLGPPTSTLPVSANGRLPTDALLHALTAFRSVTVVSLRSRKEPGVEISQQKWQK